MFPRFRNVKCIWFVKKSASDALENWKLSLPQLKDLEAGPLGELVWLQHLLWLRTFLRTTLWCWIRIVDHSATVVWTTNRGLIWMGDLVSWSGSSLWICNSFQWITSAGKCLGKYTLLYPRAVLGIEFAFPQHVSLGNSMIVGPGNFSKSQLKLWPKAILLVNFQYFAIKLLLSTTLPTPNYFLLVCEKGPDFRILEAMSLRYASARDKDRRKLQLKP